MKKILFLIICIPSLYYCSKNDTSIEEVSNFNETELLTNIGNKILLPSIHSFQENCESLEESIVMYRENQTELHLQDVREKWKLTAKSYANIYVFNIGQIKRSLTHVILYNWPSFSGSIENYATNQEDITKTTVNTFGSSSKSLPGIEYLLFESDLTTVHQKFNNDPNRLEYLYWAAVILRENAVKLYSKWNPEEGNYLVTFVNNGATSIEGSFNMLYNGIYNVIDNAKVTKIGKPAGLEKTEGENQNLLQAPYSGISKDLIFENLTSIETLFFTEQSTNISDYIKFKTGNYDLTTEVKTQITNCKNALLNLNTPLSEAIFTEKEKVKEIHTTLNNIRELLAIDVRGTLSIIITPTDNDGD